MEVSSLFDNLKLCPICHMTLPEDYEEELCPNCLENQLFSRVKDFIRENDVNEYDVAREFHISRAKVKRWISEGRIEYKERDKAIISARCSKCGAPIAFGNLCQKCYREKFLTKGGYAAYVPKDGTDDNRMRFLEDDTSFREKMKK